MELRGKQYIFAFNETGCLTIDGKVGSFQLFKATETSKSLGRQIVIDGVLQVRKSSIVLGGVSIPIDAIQNYSLYTMKPDDYIKINIRDGDGLSTLYLSFYSRRLQNDKTRDLFEIFPVLISQENLTSIDRMVEVQKKAKEKTGQNLDGERLETLKILVGMSEEILLDDLAAALSLSRADLMKQIVKWKDFGLILRGNSVTINNKDDFLKALDQSFKEWETKTTSGSGKLWSWLIKKH